MNKNIVWIGIALFLLIGILVVDAYAYSDSDIALYTIGYWNFDYNLTYDNASVTGWGDNLVNNLLNPSSGNKLDNGIVGKSINDTNVAVSTTSVTSTQFNNIGRSQDFSVSCWMYIQPVAREVSVSQFFGTGTRWRMIAFGTAYHDAGCFYGCDGGISCTDSGVDGWRMMTTTWNEATNNWIIYRNTTVFAQDNTRTCSDTAQDTFDLFGSSTIAGLNRIDGCLYINKTLSAQEVEYLWNVTSVRDLGTSGGGGTPTANFSITARNSRTLAFLNSFNASIDGVSYTTTSGTINTTIPVNSTSLFRLEVNASGHYNFLNASQNVSLNQIAEMTPYSLEFISQFPANNTQQNYGGSVLTNLTYRYNGTPSSTDCTLRQGILGNTPNIYPYNVIDNGTLYFSEFGAWTGTITYNWTCIVNEFGLTFTSNNTIFYNDIVAPTITTTFINGSSYFKLNISNQFNLSDDFSLFNYNASIDQVTIDNATLSGQTTYKYNLSHSVTGLSAGIHNLSIRVADGHTATELKQTYTIDTGLFGDVLKVNDIQIKEKSASLLDDWGVTKLTDRYSFQYIPSTKKSTYTFVVTAKNSIDIMDNPNTNIKKWVIVDNNNWIDFKIKGQDDTTINIKKVKGNQVEVTVGNIKNTDKIEFESIGELNVVTNYFYFYVISGSETHPITLVETENGAFTLNITKPAEQTSPYITFNYDGAFKTVTNTSISTTLTQYSSTTSIGYIAGLYADQQGIWNITGENVSFIQRVETINITNCTGTIPDGQVINFTVYYDGTTTSADTNGTFLFSVWKDNVTLKKSLSYAAATYNFQKFCLYTNTTLNTNYQIAYASGSGIRHYTDGDTSINKTTKTKFLYVLTSGSAVIVNVVNELNNPLQNLILKMYLNDGFDGYTLVQTETIDFNGNTLFLYNPLQKYRFTLLNTSGSEVYDFGDMVIASNPLNLKIGLLGQDYYQTLLGYYYITSDLYNVSNNVTLTWYGKSISNNICLRVTWETNLNTSTEYQNCSTATAGNLTFSIPNQTGTHYAYSYIQGSTNPLEVLIYTVVTAAKKLNDYLGIDALLMQFILVLTFGLMFSWNPSWICFGVIIASVFGMAIGLMPITSAGIISLVVMSVVVWIITRT